MAKPIPIPLLPAEVFDRMMAEKPTPLQKEMMQEGIAIYKKTKKKRSFMSVFTVRKLNSRTDL
jgi:hypothetical protein